MKTSRATYHRIRWDRDLDPREFFIGYKDINDEMRELPLLEFIPEGDIPWHRVWLFRRAEEIVWDRKTRRDEPTSALSDQAACAPVASRRRAKKKSLNTFHPTAAFRFDPAAGQWVSDLSPRSGGPELRRLRVATFNVLVDKYKPERVQTLRRTPATLSKLREIEADVIALQEVSPAFLEALLSEDWVRESFCLSDGPGGRTLRSFGQLIMSRVPVKAMWRCDFSPQKRVIVADLSVGSVQCSVAAVHLTSNFKQHNTAKRARQLRLVLKQLAKTENHASIIVGDFNCEDDHEEMVLPRQEDYVDAWSLLRSGEDGITFDPLRNALADETSTTGTRHRYDRILSQSPAARLWPARVALFARAPLPTSKKYPEVVFPSDHFGVWCDFDLSDEGEPLGTQQGGTAEVRAAAPQALVSILRAACAAPGALTVQAGLRLPLETAADLIRNSLSDTHPFDVVLDDIEVVEDGEGFTACVTPQTLPEGRLATLASALRSLFPGRGGAGPGKEIVLGPFETLQAAQTARRQWIEAVAGRSFPIDALELVPRDGPLQTIALPGPAPFADNPALLRRLRSDGAWPTPRQDSVAHELLKAITATARHLGGRPCRILLSGPRRGGTHTPWSDIELVCVCPAGASLHEVARGLMTALRRAAAPTSMELVETTTLEVTLDAPLDLKLKIALVTRGAAAPAPEEAAPPLDPSSRAAVAACAVADRINAAARDSVGTHHFQVLSRAVQHWARARRIDDAAHGFPDSRAWTLMAAWVCQRLGPGLEPSVLLERFFSLLSRWDSAKPISLLAGHSGYKPDPTRDHMPVLAPLETPTNIAKCVTRSTRRTLSRELNRGWDRALKGDLDGLFEPLLPGSSGDSSWELSVHHDDGPDAGLRARSWLSAHALSLAAEIEARGEQARRGELSVRTIPGEPPHPHLTLELRGEIPRGVSFIEETLATFDERAKRALGEVELKWRRQ